jgi:uncharacterized LabA/DUF88 family protein
MAVSNSGNLALLIDGDNVSSTIIGGLMAEIANYGTASVRRIYGDWTNPNLKGWKSCLLEHSILPVQAFEYTQGKNSTDSAMIIDAMDLMYTGRFSSFCIVSSDSDFTRLAARIREQGITVYGFGERKTNKAFIAACDKFLYFDSLNGSLVDVDTEEFANVTAALQVSQPRETVTPWRASTTYADVSTPPCAVTRVQPSGKPLDQAALRGIAQAVRSTAGDDNYANLAAVGLYLGKISPDLNARNYGYERLREFVEASGLVELKWKDMGDKPPVALVCLKET